MGERFFEYHYSRTGFSVTPGLHSDTTTTPITYSSDYQYPYQYPHNYQGWSWPTRTVTYGGPTTNVSLSSSTVGLQVDSTWSVTDSRGLITKTSIDLQARRNEKQNAIAPKRSASSGYDYPTRIY